MSPSLITSNAEGLYIYNGRGISDLYRLFTTHGERLRGAAVIDKVVGKGAAALMILGGVETLHAGIISTPALQMLTKAGITVDYKQEVPNIINRSGDGICPVEHLCKDCTTASDCLPLIKQFMKDKP